MSGVRVLGAAVVSTALAVVAASLAAVPAEAVRAAPPAAQGVSAPLVAAGASTVSQVTGLVEGPTDEVLVEEATTAESRTYRLADGSFRMESFTEPVHYQQGDGGWAAIDSDLVPVQARRFAAKNAANDFRARIPADGDAAPMRVDHAGSFVGMRMRELGSDAPAIEANVATFEDVAEADRVEYEVVADGVKEEIVLDSAPQEPVAYTFDVTASEGLAARTTETGAIEFVDPSRVDDAETPEGVVMSIPSGQMWDSARVLPNGVNRPGFSGGSVLPRRSSQGSGCAGSSWLRLRLVGCHRSARGGVGG